MDPNFKIIKVNLENEIINANNSNKGNKCCLMIKLKSN